uniref:Uncharacterized protein n=1 Tax=viral metagenome TaxID=1070528 RepID=A0A6C0HFM2_9ZZZZ
MSYLAFTASPYNETFTSTITPHQDIEKKRQARKNTTIKKRVVNPNVESMLNTINDGVNVDNEGDGLASFNPPPHPQSDVPSKFIENTELSGPQKNNNNNNNNNNTIPSGQTEPFGTNDGPVSVEGFNNLPNTYSNDFYKQYVPYYNQLNQGNGSGNKDQLLEKLNYMIHLLEEQKDEKTGHIMEELILYSFLGVFMIFIVDSFARAGKYVR